MRDQTSTEMETAPPGVPRPAGPVAYVTGGYPKVSHTFIQREVAALRALGLDIVTCTIRRPPPSEVVGAAQQDEAARTFGVLEAAKNPLHLLAAHARVLARSPGRWAGAAALAWRARSDGLKAGLWQFFYFLEAAVLARHLQRTGAVHLHDHFGSSSCTVAMLAARMAGLPFSFTLHGPDVFFEAHRWRLDVKIAEARFVACISAFCRSQAMLFSAPEAWPKLHIVHCAVDPDRYAAGGRDGCSLLFVGRLSAAKGVPVLLDAMAELAVSHPGARLALIGDGPDRAALQAHAVRAGLSDRVTFAGYRDERGVAEALAGADIFVLPSFAEGLPVVLMEALAARCAVVTTRIAGIPELVRDGETGLIVPPGEAGALAGALGRLLDDAPLRQRLAEAGRAAVEAEFNLAHEPAKLACLFAGHAP
ncbi:MAG: glycosyltransferase family 4 protein [Rhodosalinus sp.]